MNFFIEKSAKHILIQKRREFGKISKVYATQPRVTAKIGKALAMC